MRAELERLAELKKLIPELEKEKNDLLFKAGLVGPAPGTFYVVGEKYTDTNFRQPAGTLEVLGPFDERTKAYQIWFARSMFHVDNCLIRYKIVDNYQSIDESKCL